MEAGRILRIAEWCFWLVVACVVFQAVFVGMAFAVGQFTNPPVCTVGYSYPLPFAACPGLQLGLQVDYALAVPGAVLALPFILPQMLAADSASVQTIAYLPLVVFVLAAVHAAKKLFFNSF